MSDDKIKTITHTASGAMCKVHLYGANVLSFESGGRDYLFVSSQAKLDGSAPIRGGIPICFPVFGPSEFKDMPQHGFARRNTWKVVEGSEFNTDVAAGLVLSLNLKDDVVEGRGAEDDLHNPWSKSSCEKDETDCTLTYEIRLEPKQLITTLVIKNTGKTNFNFNALLHTYLAVDGHAAQDPSKTHVDGLGGYAITDKVSGDSGHVQSYDEPVVMDGEIDRLFIHPEDHPVVHAKIATGTGETPNLRMEAAGQIAEQVTPVSCVIWNPAAEKAKALADLGEEEYKDFICVEPGLIGHQPLLEPDHEARLSQDLILL